MKITDIPKKKCFLVFLAGLTCFFYAQNGRPEWKSVKPPTILEVKTKETEKTKIIVSFNLEIGANGADRCTVDMLDGSGTVLSSKPVGRSSREIKTAEFAAEGSGSYTFIVNAFRADENEAKNSPPVSHVFSYPLAQPVITVLNIGSGSLRVTWNSVHEAAAYEVSYSNPSDNKLVILPPVIGTEMTLAGLVSGKKYLVRVSAIRNTEKMPSNEYGKTVKNDPDRVWNFTWFGQSSRADTNTIEMIDADDLKFTLNSCSVNAKGDVELKGGKFTTFHDGISFFYTVIDPKKENFELTATVSIDYINPIADGQEGFGLLVMDSLGTHGSSMTNHYTNSAGILATKFEETIGGIKRTAKDTLGARFVSGITPEVLALGDSGISEFAENASHAFSYDQSELVKKGDTYRLTLKKTNTGFHAVYARLYATDETITEFIMYRTDKLLQLDKERMYAGFAVARGCNATFSDISMIFSDPDDDSPARAEPAQLIPLSARVDSPKTCTEETYRFVFNANADGILEVSTSRGKPVISRTKIGEGRDFSALLKLENGMNEYMVKFTVDPAFAPGPGKAMGVWDGQTKKYIESAAPLMISHTVIRHSYSVPQLYVSPIGNAFGKGTKASPLDLETAINFVKPGQPIVLEGGTYYPPRGVVIERGNDGTEKNPKTLKSEPNARAILNFSKASSGMAVWADYWIIEGIDVCNTVGNVKGLQIAGNGNIASRINTYACGDTGLQISGSSAEPFEKWPKNNLVLNCTSYNNSDPAQNNADGFAAKITCGEGNVFRGCIAYSNIDDGWDLFSKIESGPIGAVVIENCVAYKNGSLLDGSGNGDGNGFKLGGDGIAVPHILRNSIAYNNGASGITSNSDPAIIIENNTSFGNKQVNVNLYGKGTGTRSFKAKNIISIDGGSADVIREMSGLASPDNYFWNGAKAANSLNESIGKEVFVSTDMNVLPGRKADGSIDMKGLFTLNAKAPKGIGAALK